MKCTVPLLLVGIALAPLSAAAQVRVAGEGTLGATWQLAGNAPLATPAYPPRLARLGVDACIALAYRVGVDGRTGRFAVLRQWNNLSGGDAPVDGFWRGLAGAGADAVAQWRFQPRQGIPVLPTDTVATIVFIGPRGAAPETIRAHCRIEDLAGALARARGRREDAPQAPRPQDKGGIFHELADFERRHSN